MNQYYLLYNPHAGKKNCKEEVDVLAASYTQSISLDITEIESYKEFFEKIAPTDSVIICGGDGTLNRFVNETKDLEIQNPLYYYAIGSGNDFVRDVTGSATTKEPILLTDYIKDLPTVEVKGEKYLFLNGVGYGLDGFCCEMGDKQKLVSDKAVNYTAIAIKAVLFQYKPTNATITVDGVTKTYKRVWIAPAMNGRYYGGGMMTTPEQDRLGEEKNLSLMVFHNGGKLRILTILPTIFEGKHVKHKKQVEILTGHDIHVQFDSPRALQIDGETIVDVTEYHAKSRKIK